MHVEYTEQTHLLMRVLVYMNHIYVSIIYNMSFGLKMSV